LKTCLSFFGRKLNLASRDRRRWLVVIFYIVADPDRKAAPTGTAQ